MLILLAFVRVLRGSFAHSVNNMMWLLALCACLRLGQSTVPGHRDVNLLEVRVSAGYRRVLDKAYSDLVLWSVVNQHERPDSISNDADKMNVLFSAYVQFLF